MLRVAFSPRDIFMMPSSQPLITEGGVGPCSERRLAESVLTRKSVLMGNLTLADTDGEHEGSAAVV